MTPNPAERPSWGSDLRFLWLFHLKQFAYTFQKNVIQGMYKESKNAYNEEGGGVAGAGAALGYALPLAAIFIGFAAMANEIREEIQYRLGGQYRPSNYMPWDKYMEHLITNRIGVGAVISPWTDALMNNHNRTVGVMSLSPLVGKIDQLIHTNNNMDRLMDITPFLAQNPGGQRAIMKIIREQDA